METDKLVQFMETLKQPVTEAALEAARMEAYSNLVSNLFCLGMGTLLCYMAWVLYKKYLGTDKSTYSNEDRTMTYALGCGVSILLGFLFVAIAITGLIDPWLWSTIYNPELWVAKQVLGL